MSNPDIIITQAAPEHHAQIAEIWQPIIRETTAIFHTENRDAEFVGRFIAQRRGLGRDFWVALAGERVLGFATYDQFRSGNGYLHAMEHSVMLRPEARGRGVGRALMEVLEDHARGSGAHAMIAAIDAANAPARAFHAALGYAEVGYMPELGRKFDRWLDLVLMQKLL